jgi:tetratricopeptide (TPR) repeat protein
MKVRNAVLTGAAAMASLMASACSTAHGNLEKSARASYVNGNYDQALVDAAKSLRMKPDYGPSIELVRDVYPKAVESHLENIKEAKASRAKFRWDGIVSEYSALLQDNQAIKSLPSLRDPRTKASVKFDTQDFTDLIADARTNAAEEHYQEGRRMFGQQGITARDRAAAEFRTATGFVPGYKDATALIAEGYYQEGKLLSRDKDIDVQKQAAKAFAAAQDAMPGYKDAAVSYQRSRSAAIKRIAIVPFEDRSGKARQFGDVIGTIVDGVISNVKNDPTASEFLEIVSRDQLDRVIAEQKLGASGLLDDRTATKIGKLVGVHEIITGKVTQIIVSPEQTTSRNFVQQARVCDRRREVIDNKGKKHTECIWDDIAAQVTQHHRAAGVTITGSYTVIDVKTGAVRETQQLGGAYQFSGDWATVYGDPRALQGEAKMLASRVEQTAPVTDEMVREAARDLLTKFSSTLKNYTR